MASAAYFIVTIELFINQFPKFAPQKFKHTQVMAKNEKSGIEIIENADALKKEFFKAENFFEKNSKLIGIIGGVIIAAIVAFYGYNYYIKQQNIEAQNAMYDSVFYFEADSLNAALNGNGGNAGLLEIADSYGSTPAGNLAKYYVGLAYIKQGKYDEAISYLNEFDADDIVLQGKAYSLIGDANLEKGDNDAAIAAYKKAADYKPNKNLTPGYLMKLAMAYETAGDKAAAIETYGKIVDSYPNSIENLNALKYKTMLETQAGQ